MRKMTHIRMILKHLCLSGMLGIIRSKITWFWGYILLPLYSMSLISVKLIIFPNFGQGPFPKIAGKSPAVYSLVATHIVQWSKRCSAHSISPSLTRQLEWLLTEPTCFTRIDRFSPVDEAQSQFLFTTRPFNLGSISSEIKKNWTLVSNIEPPLTPCADPVSFFRGGPTLTFFCILVLFLGD